MMVKFLTLNIWGGTLLDNVISFLKDEDADIVCLQEVYNGIDLNWEKSFRSFDILKKELAYPYTSFAPHVLDKRSFGKIDQGNVVMSKFPIISEKVTFFDVPYGERSQEGETDWSGWPCNLQEVTIDVQGKNVHVFNTHGPWGLDGKDNSKRLTMSKIIVDNIKDKERVMLAGDFNVQPNTKTVENIEEYMVNVFKNELQSTFNMKHKTNPGYATAVVDMIFVSPNISVVHHLCPEVDVSDHLPLVCSLDI